jgi:hypothetical protein
MLKMVSLQETKRRIRADRKYWTVALMDFVDDFRYHKNPAAIAEPVNNTDPQMDAMLASTAEYLCDELGLEHPSWLSTVPASPTPGSCRE